MFKKMTEFPRLQSTRVRLRLMMIEDWSEYFSLMQSQRAIYMGGPFSIDIAWGMFCQDVAQWALMGHGALMIEDISSKLCVGQVGINSGPLFPEHELGWFVYPDYERKGYALEAAMMLRDWALKEEGLNLNTLVSYVDSDNTRSRRLAERLGAQLDAEACRPDPKDLVYRHQLP